MARRKKHQKLPNGFGSIKYLGKGRYKPYGVYPPVTEYTAKGPVTPKALAYVETWDEGYAFILTVLQPLKKYMKISIKRSTVMSYVTEVKRLLPCLQRK